MVAECAIGALWQATGEPMPCDSGQHLWQSPSPFAQRKPIGHRRDRVIDPAKARLFIGPKANVMHNRTASGQALHVAHGWLDLDLTGAESLPEVWERVVFFDAGIQRHLHYRKNPFTKDFPELYPPIEHVGQF